MKKDKNLLDIVFSQSAAGGMKYTFVPKLMDKENVMCVHFGLAEGDISEDFPAEKRLASIKAGLAHLPAEIYGEVADEMMSEATAALEKVLEHAAAGKPVRLWYSNNLYELCGMYHLLYLISRLDSHGRIYTVFLPDTVQKADGTIVRHMGWGGVSPQEWQACFNPQQATSAFIAMCAGEWRRLKADNAPVRGVLNGVLHSLPRDIYDSFILKEIYAADREFMQAKVIGNVLGKYQLAISDGWVAQRMEKMIQQGIITPVTAPPEDAPVYHRKMKKNI